MIGCVTCPPFTYATVKDGSRDLALVLYKEYQVSHYHIVQNSGRKTFGEFMISKFWQGKLWQMLDTCIIGRRKTLVNLRVNYLLLTP